VKIPRVRIIINNYEYSYKQIKKLSEPTWLFFDKINTEHTVTGASAMVYLQLTSEHQTATCPFSLGGIGERMGRVKVRKLVG